MKPSRKIQSVYRNQNALVRAVFERSGDARMVLCVALDYAKRKHATLAQVERWLASNLDYDPE
jgi:hypothetical protein